MKNYSAKELIQMFWKSVILILVLAVLGGGAMGYRAKKQQHTTYTASQEIVISHNLNENSNSSDNGQDSITNADLNMMTTYAEIAKDETISETAHKILPKSIKKNYSVQDVNDAIRAVPHQQSLVLSIKAKTGSAKASVAIANATAKAVKKDLPKLQPGAGTVTLLAKPTTKSVTSETLPHAKKYAMVGAAMGGLIGIVISFVVITLKDLVKKRK
ncbi:YveK family protein [Limosilactobacillus mucosae]|uniref:YveK family protein n=1 Tax=Limosilactobacillus mucosae TaxID=97478 RepID=UPI00233EB365|nr:chain-length determining protein [Limosilactobacillus mucosae]MDC2840492.1 chain-length determining protein [Limosilactobacillus mucosae]